MRKLKHNEAREAVPSGAMMINSMSNPRGTDFGLSALRDFFFPQVSMVSVWLVQANGILINFQTRQSLC